MKTTVKKMDYEQVMALPRGKHWTPKKPNLFWRTLVRAISGLGMGGCKLDATIEGLDKIVFVEDGRIVAVGSHQELLSACSAYARMVELQRLEDESKE